MNKDCEQIVGPCTCGALHLLTEFFQPKDFIETLDEDIKFHPFSIEVALRANEIIKKKSLDYVQSKVLILCGLPGAGKTTFAEKYYESWIRISQDELGSREACIQKAGEALRRGRTIIIDRCNHTVAQRQHWIDLANQHGTTATCMFLSVNPDECFHRINLRKNHPTISEYMSSEQKRNIINHFFLEFEPPTLAEGFLEVILRRNDL